jgi:hypothetical protein
MGKLINKNQDFLIVTTKKLQSNFKEYGGFTSTQKIRNYSKITVKKNYHTSPIIYGSFLKKQKLEMSKISFHTTRVLQLKLIPSNVCDEIEDFKGLEDDIKMFIEHVK